MKKEVLVVLGSPNSPSGELSDISISRLDYCLDLYSAGKLILCTGGWGEHFNISDEAHAVYSKRYLMENGVSENDFLDLALSKNTVDDAIKVKDILSKLDDYNATLITSDFHLERVKLIFEEILKDIRFEFLGVPCAVEGDQLERIISHEKKAIKLITENGLYW